jgi:hypothetical protein
VIVSFSNRQFYSKAVQGWRDGTGYSRTLLVKSYFLAVAGFTEPEAVTEVTLPCFPFPLLLPVPPRDPHLFFVFACVFLLVASWPAVLSYLSACAAWSVCVYGGGRRGARMFAYVHVQVST